MDYDDQSRRAFFILFVIILVADFIIAGVMYLFE
jgi:hypothetical protein